MGTRQPSLRSGAWRVGFFVAIAVVAVAAVSILWSQLQTGNQSREVVARALERAQLITRLRVSAMALEAAVEAHLRAPSDAQREEAAAVMDRILGDLQSAQSAYLQLLRAPREDHLELWKRFDAACRALADEVRSAARARPSPADARKLSERIGPLLTQVDSLATQLARENASSAARVQLHLDGLRTRALKGGGGVLLGALAVASLLGAGLSLTLRRQERIIAQQLAELDRRNQELDAFAGRVAHDLLSPLAPLRGHLTVARRSAEVRAAPQVSEHLDKALSSTERVTGLVDALLRFHRAAQRADAGAGMLDAVVAAQLMEVDQLAAANGVVVDRSLERGVQVACSSQLLQSLAQNLLSNAVKYTAGTPSARVEVRVFKAEGSGCLVVSDNGPGMTPEVQANLGQPFYRAPEVRQTHPGFGLGLAITRRLVEAHQGTLEIQSAPGQGTKVRVTLPLAPSVAAESLSLSARAEPLS